MNAKEAEAVLAAAKVLGHKAFTLLSTKSSNERYNYAVRFESEDYGTRFVTDSVGDALYFISNNQPT